MKLIMFNEEQRKDITEPILGNAQTKLQKYYEVPGIHAGIWECHAGEFTIESHASHEVCFILEGECNVTLNDASVQRLKTGDSFIIPKGTKMIWTIEKYIRKVYMAAQ